MIEGNLSDVSLPGLLQFLATESNKSFRVKLVSGPQRGEIFISEGEILAANYGLLEGNDALTEFLFWAEGTFIVERLASRLKDSVSVNLKIVLKQVNTFADQMLFLQESGVGLNTELVPSPRFGTQAWQEDLQKQPLHKEDFAVLGWITDGRTMRQAMREFNFDVIKATSSLFRLVFTRSVETVRPSVSFEVSTADSAKTEVAPQSDNAPLQEVGDNGSVSGIATAGSAAPEIVPVKDGDTAAEKTEKTKPAKRKAVATEENLPAADTQAFKDMVAKAEPEKIVVSTETSDNIPSLSTLMTASGKAAQAPAQENISNQVITGQMPQPVASAPAKQKFEVKIDPDQARSGQFRIDGTQAESNRPAPATASQPSGVGFSDAAASLKDDDKFLAMRRTDPLPLVAIDIERLFQTTFKVTPFGQMALNNEALDSELRDLIASFKKGLTFINVAMEGNQRPAQALYTVKFALERGYIEPPDQVVSLTADLLLGRVELEQYLLQRRRITGDELRDVIDLARQKGIKLVELLVKMGFMTESDWFRLNQEKERFAPR